MVIPYVKGVSEQVRRVMKGYRVKVYFKPTNTLRQILVRPKDKVIKERVVCPVYHISCDNCGESYIRETRRSLKARFSEHKRPSSVSSEVSKHINCDHPDHSISLNKMKILEVELKWFERRVREAIQIRMNNPPTEEAGKEGGPGPRSSNQES